MLLSQVGKTFGKATVEKGIRVVTGIYMCEMCGRYSKTTVVEVNIRIANGNDLFTCVADTYYICIYHSMQFSQTQHFIRNTQCKVCASIANS
jgi:hypothetical protein